MVHALPGVSFRLMSSVPSLNVRPHGLGRFILSGVVPSFADPALTLQSPVGAIDVPLAEKSKARDAVRALQRRLPRGLRGEVRELLDGTELSLQETQLPAAALPRVVIVSTDLDQRIRPLDENRFEVLGQTSDDCLVTFQVERRRTVVAIAKGTGAEATARLLAARVPYGYVALAEGSIVTVWKDADVTTIAA